MVVLVTVGASVRQPSRTREQDRRSAYFVTGEHSPHHPRSFHCSQPASKIFFHGASDGCVFGDMPARFSGNHYSNTRPGCVDVCRRGRGGVVLSVERILYSLVLQQAGPQAFRAKTTHLKGSIALFPETGRAKTCTTTSRTNTAVSNTQVSHSCPEKQIPDGCLPFPEHHNGISVSSDLSCCPQRRLYRNSLAILACSQNVWRLFGAHHCLCSRI